MYMATMSITHSDLIRCQTSSQKPLDRLDYCRNIH